MTLVVRAVFWVIAYLGAVLSPLVFAAIGASHPDHGFWTNFSVALGFVGLAMLGLEFVLVARVRALASPFGQDALLQPATSRPRSWRAISRPRTGASSSSSAGRTR